MPERCFLPLEVRTYEVDAYGRAPVAAYLKWMQDAAIFGSAANGFDTKRYDELGTTWVLGEIVIGIDGECAIGDRITVETWIADLAAASSHRQYRVRSEAGDLIATGEADWVYLDARRMRPRRIHPELVEAFPMVADYAIADRDWAKDLIDAAPEGPDTHEMRHTVLWSELDGARHVNNTVYAGWVTDQLAARNGEEEGPGRISRLRLKYRRGARLGEKLSWRLAVSDGTAVQHVLAPDGGIISQAVAEVR